MKFRAAVISAQTYMGILQAVHMENENCNIFTFGVRVYNNVLKNMLHMILIFYLVSSQIIYR